MANIALVGTFDTKGTEYQYLAEMIEKFGAETTWIDLSIMGPNRTELDYPADAVAAEGGMAREKLQALKDRETAQKTMAAGGAKIVGRLCLEGKIHGIVSMGGSQGVSMLSRIYSELPIGFPKLMLSPLASIPGKMAMFEGINDTLAMNTIVDIAGLNHILKQSLETAAASITASAKAYHLRKKEREKPVVGISMFGITTKCVSVIEQILMDHGYEVLVFHANGAGGRSLEKMVRDGQIGAVLDITPSEVGQHFLGGTCDAGPHRMEAMVEREIPYIVSAGALDVVNFMAKDPIPKQYEGRHFHMHGLVAKVMRTSGEECTAVGKIIGEKLNRSKRPENIRILLPLKGISANDAPGNECYQPDADESLFASIKSAARPEIKVTELEYHINDREFAEYAAKLMMEMYPMDASI